MNTQDRLTQIQTKLEFLNKYLSIVLGKGKLTSEQLISDDDLRGVIERNLQLSCEVVFDIADQLIAEYRFRTPEDHKDSIIVLGEVGILEEKFAKEFSGMAGFRNILVHDYVKIDYGVVADIVNNHLTDFETFARSVAKYLSA